MADLFAKVPFHPGTVCGDELSQEQIYTRSRCCTKELLKAHLQDEAVQRWRRRLVMQRRYDKCRSSLKLTLVTAFTVLMGFAAVSQFSQPLVDQVQFRRAFKPQLTRACGRSR